MSIQKNNPFTSPEYLSSQVQITQTQKRPPSNFFQPKRETTHQFDEDNNAKEKTKTAHLTQEIIK
jgi:hypothetical protein